MYTCLCVYIYINIYFTLFTSNSINGVWYNFTHEWNKTSRWVSYEIETLAFKTLRYKLINRHVTQLFWNSWENLNLLQNEFRIDLLMRLRIHFCLQFYCAHSPMPAFSNVLIVNSLPFRTQDIRAGAMLCGTTKPGFCYSSCDTTEICNKCMRLSILLSYVRGP